MTITFHLFDKFVKNLGLKKENISADTISVALTNTAPSQTGNEVIGDITQISGTGGYAVDVPGSVTWAETGAGSGIWQFTTANATWTASGASFDSFRYIVVYDSTSGDLIGYYERGSGLVLVNGATYTLIVSASGHFQASYTP